MEPLRDRERICNRTATRRLIGISPAFRSQIENLPRIAQSPASVLVHGETGTGKEVVARAIHQLSARAGQPFVPVNCGAIPNELVESELFGHEKGAFTGAIAVRPGLVEEAHHGTLFLDEVDSLSLQAQVKLLRFLQEREFRRLGSPTIHTSDARILAATNTDIRHSVSEGKVRRDLYYRLNVLHVDLPPLRERIDDVLLLAGYFLTRHCPADRPAPKLLPATEDHLIAYDWPGNVRELEHIIERALVLSHPAPEIRPCHLGLRECDTRPIRIESMEAAKQRVVDRFERVYIEKMLVLHHGNISRAARAAQRSRRGFWGLIKKHQVDATRFRQ